MERQVKEQIDLAVEGLSQGLNRHVLLVNGANLNLLGRREPQIYGHTSLGEIERDLMARAAAFGVRLSCVQSNVEGELVTQIQNFGLLFDPADQVDAVIINPAGFTHTSVVLRDALLAVDKPFIEVHLSNIHAREAFRQVSYFSDKAVGVICGLGFMGYQMALDYFLRNLYQVDIN